MMMLDNAARNQRVSSFIEEPADADILCGKDKTYAKHPGNILYRNLIQAMSRVYAETPTKQEKMRMTAEIVQKMKVEHGSRFLKNSSGWCSGGNSAWEEISVTAARDKTSHALRFCAANPHGTSSSSAAPPVTVSPTLPSRRSLRSQRQRRLLHRRTVSSEKVPLLHAASLYDTVTPNEAYSMPHYQMNGSTYYSDESDHYQNSNWYASDEAAAASLLNEEVTGTVTPDAVVSHCDIPVAVIPNVPSDAAARASINPTMPPRLEAASSHQDEEDLDAILREPLNWDEMEDDDLFFL